MKLNINKYHEMKLVHGYTGSWKVLTASFALGILTTKISKQKYNKTHEGNIGTKA